MGPERQVGWSESGSGSWKFMPRPTKNLWPQVVDFGSLYTAWREARCGKRYYDEVLRFYGCLEDNLLAIQQALIAGTWFPSPCREFVIREPKLRLVQAPTFADRIVHRSLVKAIEPSFERRFIADSYACRKDKGPHEASKRLHSFITTASANWHNPYALKADIKSYFPSIRHDILLCQISRSLGDVKVLDLCEKIVLKNGFTDAGLPIGALTSQLFANVYLDKFDHFVKDELGIKFYVRYMDDFIIVGRDRQCLQATLKGLENFLNSQLKLRLNPKTSIFPISHGIDFSGYRHWTTHTLPRKRNTRRARLDFRRIAREYAEGRIDFEYIRPRVASFCGQMKHCDAYRTTESVLSELVLVRPSPQKN